MRCSVRTRGGTGSPRSGSAKRISPKVYIFHRRPSHAKDTITQTIRTYYMARVVLSMCWKERASRDTETETTAAPITIAIRTESRRIRTATTTAEGDRRQNLARNCTLFFFWQHWFILSTTVGRSEIERTDSIREGDRAAAEAEEADGAVEMMGTTLIPIKQILAGRIFQRRGRYIHRIFHELLRRP